MKTELPEANEELTGVGVEPMDNALESQAKDAQAAQQAAHLLEENQKLQEQLTILQEQLTICRIKRTHFVMDARQDILDGQDTDADTGC